MSAIKLLGALLLAGLAAISPRRRSRGPEDLSKASPSLRDFLKGKKQ